ncbi:MAG: ornithine carbamoyltransferase [Symbiobacterium sp.]|uniref:ornithine carbamoyltransferase n=1 Tax=Symbiobacterium sp. TaxID=1971213 RepID=UPI003463E629
MKVLALKGRDFISLHDWSREELEEVLALAQWQKARLQQGILDTALKGKQLGMYFAKPSTRTRLSFEVGIQQLGGRGLFLSADDLQLSRGESIADTARVMSRFLHGIMIRTFAHQDVTELARWATIPVINGLTDEEHPCQVMADLLTILERFGTLEGIKLAYVGDGNNMAHSLMDGGAKFGMHVAVACPEGYKPDPARVARAQATAARHGALVEVLTDPAEAVAGAHVVYTDVWVSMGQEREAEARWAAFRGYQVNSALMRLAAPQAVFMHCLPAHRGEEVTAEVIDGPQSVVFDQAENRLHAQKAIMTLIMAD